jgi:hypothetical protein
MDHGGRRAEEGRVSEPNMGEEGEGIGNKERHWMRHSAQGGTRHTGGYGDMGICVCVES